MITRIKSEGAWAVGYGGRWARSAPDDDDDDDDDDKKKKKKKEKGNKNTRNNFRAYNCGRWARSATNNNDNNNNNNNKNKNNNNNKCRGAGCCGRWARSATVWRRWSNFSNLI